MNERRFPRHRRLNFATALVVGAGLLIAAAPVAAKPGQPAKRYASPTSTDVTGTCTSSNPCRIDWAVGGAAEGAEVIVKPGEYLVNAPIVATKAVDVRGANESKRPVLLPDALLASDTLTLDAGGSVSDLEIESIHPAAAALVLQGGTAERLALHAAAGRGAILKGATGGTVLRDSLVRAEGARAAVRTEDGATPGQISVVNVTAVAAGAGSNGLVNAQTTVAPRVRNSVLRGDDGDIASDTSPLTVDVDYSNFRASSSAGFADGGRNQGADPRLLADLRPTEGSPTIDAGLGTEPLLGSRDLDHKQRIFGAAPDLGAFEYRPPDPAPEEEGGKKTVQLPPAGKPVLGRSVSLRAASGTVLVTLPGSSQQVPLERASGVPVGSTIDATQGVVALTSVKTRSGAEQTGRFWGGEFRVGQTLGKRPITDLRLTGAGAPCPAADTAGSGVRSAGRARSAASRRRLWGSDKRGRFRTRGRGGSATVRGTRWSTEDTCDGTVFRVRKGAVLVRDFGRAKRVLLQAGGSYSALNRASR